MIFSLISIICESDIFYQGIKTNKDVKWYCIVGMTRLSLQQIAQVYRDSGPHPPAAPATFPQREPDCEHTSSAEAASRPAQCRRNTACKHTQITCSTYTRHDLHE